MGVERGVGVETCVGVERGWDLCGCREEMGPVWV